MDKCADLRKRKMETSEEVDPEKVTNLLRHLERMRSTNREKIERREMMSKSKWSFPVIYRITDEIREQNKNPYSPTTVSIGPLHRGRTHLEAMEVDKLIYMDTLFGRTADASEETPRREIIGKTQRKCAEAVLKMESDARRYYSEVMMERDENDFAAGMLIDSCFIIELLYRDYRRRTLSDDVGSGWDPILDNESLKLAITHDLIRLENQIPLVVLNIIFAYTVQCIPTGSSNQPPPSLTNYLLPFFGDMIGFNQNNMKVNECSNLEPTHILHLLHSRCGPDKDEKKRPVKEESVESTYILHLLHNCYGPNKDKKKRPVKEKSTESTRILHLLHNCYRPGKDERKRPVKEESVKEAWKKLKYSATQLDHAGVKFHAGVNGNLFHVKFWSDHWLLQTGHLEIPPLRVTYSTEPLMKNLIAFEQSCPLIENYFTSHAFLMDKLINSAQDVDLLVEAGVIHNYLGSAKEVSILYNSICSHVVLRDFYFPQPLYLLNRYCNRLWPRLLVTLRRDYFGNPWAIIAVIAAAILFTIAFLQTIYALLSYYHHQS